MMQGWTTFALCCSIVLLLGDEDVVVLELEKKRLDLIEDEGLAHRLALVNACREAGCEMHDGLDARLGVECLIGVLEPKKVSSVC